ncbi:TraV family lipoprotein [Novosphingobium album (ex Liu et al. 2023)]|uniref:TraV family lipoprotein n=1 Tax=Novosphingobium album (ex Liu et al. 2023) TaxID=3031130 RepID=A0ABT5WX19_9SPHN|nr:TraV family lipoprotein [Novosphingobium album (ex Liu et al. 2023)]MDE8654459.1 TraV family lipoprotein [Novosphingobium album (ex Liu et al. 2023)]
MSHAAHSARRIARRLAAPCLSVAALALLSGCATLGSMMSPYSEKFSCKNRDHGQCIHPEEAYADAVAGVPSHSDPAVTHDKAMLKGTPDGTPAPRDAKSAKQAASPYYAYRDSVYREMQGLIDAPTTPMLRAGRTVRTLIMPYADRERPDRLYMPRYVYSILERPQWVVGDYLVNPVEPAGRVPVLEQMKDKGHADPAVDGEPAPVPAMPEERRK